MAILDIRAFEYALSSIDDGTVFETFALAFLSAVMGYDFLPAGRTKDRGIDAIEYCFVRKGFEKQIYQLSTEKDYEAKMRESLEKLKTNKIMWTSFRYVTNRDVPKRDVLIDELSTTYKGNVTIFDSRWFVAHAVESDKTINAYTTHILSHLHEFAQPGSSRMVTDLGRDGRLFVFFRQQFDSSAESAQVDELLADSLIILSLEDTDPDQHRFKTLAEIKQAIKALIRFDFKAIEHIIENRVQDLSKKPHRQVIYHSDAKAYCLPYATRQRLQERNLRDQQLTDRFFEQTESKLRAYL